MPCCYTEKRNVCSGNCFSARTGTYVSQLCQTNLKGCGLWVFNHRERQKTTYLSSEYFPALNIAVCNRFLKLQLTKSNWPPISIAITEPKFTQVKKPNPTITCAIVCSVIKISYVGLSWKSKFHYKHPLICRAKLNSRAEHSTWSCTTFTTT